MKRRSWYIKGICQYIPLKRKNIKITTTIIAVNISKLIAASVSRDITNAKTTQTSSKFQSKNHTCPYMDLNMHQKKLHVS